MATPPSGPNMLAWALTVLVIIVIVILVLALL
jgi:hypothetical protein